MTFWLLVSVQAMCLPGARIPWGQEVPFSFQYLARVALAWGLASSDHSTSYKCRWLGPGWCFMYGPGNHQQRMIHHSVLYVQIYVYRLPGRVKYHCLPSKGKQPRQQQQHNAHIYSTVCLVLPPCCRCPRCTAPFGSAAPHS